MFNFLSAVEDIREYMHIYVLKRTDFDHLRKLITTPLKVLAHQISEFSLQDDGPLAGFKGSLVKKNAKKQRFFTMSHDFATKKFRQRKKIFPWNVF